VPNIHGRFAWYDLVTTDTGAAKAFYTKVMGWGALDASLAGRTYTLFTSGKVVVCGLIDLSEDARKMGGEPSWLGYVAVDDVDATAERVTYLGGAVYVPPTDIPNVSRFSTFADPQTGRLALLKWLNPGHEQPVELGGLGRVGWHELLAADLEKALAFYGELFGWQKADADIGDMGTYQRFSAGGQTIGGILTKPPMIPTPYWIYYFNIRDLDAAVQRVKTGGGQILDGPIEVADGSWIVRCIDPQGAIFALQGKRERKAIGYFERVAPRNPSDARSRRWSW
jgi:predicted enzyme related to lactoylglutathione lyase